MEPSGKFGAASSKSFLPTSLAAASEYSDPGFFICAAVQYDDPLASKHYGQLSFMR